MQEAGLGKTVLGKTEYLTVFNLRLQSRKTCLLEMQISSKNKKFVANDLIPFRGVSLSESTHTFSSFPLGEIKHARDGGASILQPWDLLWQYAPQSNLRSQLTNLCTNFSRKIKLPHTIYCLHNNEDRRGCSEMGG